MSNSSHEPTVPLNARLSEIAIGNQNSLMAILNSYEKWVRSTVQIQSELMDFVSMRMKKDLEIPQRLAQCSDTADLIEQHMEIANTMIKDYADENQKIMKLISQATLDIELEAESALSDGEKRKSG
jgi:hypothetical protein